MPDTFPDPEEILEMVSKIPPRRNKVEKWMDENPDKGAVFVQTVKKSVTRGLPLTHVVSKCQEVLGGPPGSITTIRLALRKYVEEEKRD